MTGSDDGVDARPIWAINGRYMTQRMTGVQRYAYEIVASLDKILSEDGDIAKRLGFRLILPGEVEVKPALSQIDVCQTKLGSGHAWDQFVLPWYARSDVLSLGNFGPIAARNLAFMTRIRSSNRKVIRAASAWLIGRCCR